MEKTDWLPERKDLEQVLLVYLKYREGNGEESNETYNVLGDFFGISEQQRAERYPTGNKEKIWDANVRATIRDLRENKKIVSKNMDGYTRGVWKLNRDA